MTNLSPPSKKKETKKKERETERKEEIELYQFL